MIVNAVATGYPFLDIFLTILIVAAWVVYVWIAIVVLIDVFRRDDLSGWGKAGWTVLVILLEWLGVLAYVVLNQRGMAERRAKDDRAAYAQFGGAARSATGSGSPAGEIERAKSLLDNGTINQNEFEELKDQALRGDRAVAGDTA